MDQVPVEVRLRRQEVITRNAKCRRYADASLRIVLLAALLAGAAPAQGVIVDAGAGVFRGDRPTYNGPVFHVRVSVPLRSSTWLGVRGTYRDDDPSSGRARSVGMLAEGQLVLTGRTGAIYLPVGVGVEWVSVTTENVLPAGDAKSAAYLATDIGLGVEVNGGTRRLIIEGRQSFRKFGNSRSLSIGIRSYATAPSLSAPAIDLAASTLSSLNGSYARDRQYQGYAVAYVRPLASPFPTDVRVSLGIDFLEFNAGGGSWSTGSVALALGAGYRVASIADGKVSISVVGEAGLLHFAEPSGRAPSPLVALGGEVRLLPGSLGFVVGYHAVLSGGPAGTLTAGQLRLGLTMKL